MCFLLTLTALCLFCLTQLCHTWDLFCSQSCFTEQHFAQADMLSPPLSHTHCYGLVLQDWAVPHWGFVEPQDCLHSPSTHSSQADVLFLLVFPPPNTHCSGLGCCSADSAVLHHLGLAFFFSYIQTFIQTLPRQMC